jgi:hypothetical protein
MIGLLLSTAITIAYEHASKIVELNSEYLEDNLPPYYPEMTAEERSKAEVQDGWLVMPVPDIQFT